METLRNGRWFLKDLLEDLKKQGGLQATLDLFSIIRHPGLCCGQTQKGTFFFITWKKDAHLLVTVSQEEPGLIKAFSNIVEYEPFCRYEEKLRIEGKKSITFEWDKIDPDGRFAELKKDAKKKGYLMLRKIK